MFLTGLKKTISSELVFKFGVRTLIGFSLLEIKEQKGRYAMHPVVQDWCIFALPGETKL